MVAKRIRVALARPLERFTRWLRYGFQHLRRCEACQAYDGAHAFDCPRPRTNREWRALAVQYYRAWRRDTDRAQQTARNAWRQSHLWQGKYHTLRLENNALRRRLYQQNRKKAEGETSNAT